jgi:septum formation topological specificity factor MinE
MNLGKFFFGAPTGKQITNVKLVLICDPQVVPQELQAKMRQEVLTVIARYLDFNPDSV